MFIYTENLIETLKTSIYSPKQTKNTEIPFTISKKKKGDPYLSNKQFKKFSVSC